MVHYQSELAGINLQTESYIIAEFSCLKRHLVPSKMSWKTLITATMEGFKFPICPVLYLLAKVQMFQTSQILGAFLDLQLGTWFHIHGGQWLKGIHFPSEKCDIHVKDVEH